MMNAKSFINSNELHKIKLSLDYSTLVNILDASVSVFSKTNWFYLF